MPRRLLLKGTLVAGGILGTGAAWALWPLPTDPTRNTGDPARIAASAAYLKNVARSGGVHPNVIVILADDLGRQDISTYGGTVPTPHLDALAASGVRFDAGYVSAPICAPSRAGFLTGRNQQRFGFELQTADRYPRNRFERWLAARWLKRDDFLLHDLERYPAAEATRTQGLPPGELTFADLARSQGYRTGIVGKWHQGSAPGLRPTERGFDTHYGFYQAWSLYVPEGAPGFTDHHHADVTDRMIWGTGVREGLTAIRRDDTVIDEKGYLTDRIADESEAFITAHRADPFVLYVPFNAPHTPFQARTGDVQRAPGADENHRVYHAMIQALDAAIGRILARVRSEGLEEKTLILFASDNGGAVYTNATTNVPLRGGKFSHFEGGIRVPFLASWKGRIKPGTVHRHPVSTLDILPTIAALSGAPLPTDRIYDGRNLLPAIDSGEPLHEALFWRAGRAKAVRAGAWKLVQGVDVTRPYLFDLDADPSESRNLAQEHPDIVNQLGARLAEWEKGLTTPLWPSLTSFEFHFSDGPYVVDL